MALLVDRAEPQDEVALLGGQAEKLVRDLAVRLAKVLLYPPDDVLAYGVLMLKRRKVARP
jgi:hypothetical protein